MATQKILLVNPSNAPKKRARKKPRTAAQKAATKKLIAFNKARRKSTSAPKKKRAAPKRKTSTKKRSTTMAARKRRTAAQRAATKKLIAFNKRRARKKNPSSSSPARRRAYTASRTASPPRRRRNPVRKVIRHRRRNPSMKTIGKGIIGGMVMPAVTATGGALALDLAWGYLPIPIQFKTGSTRLLAKSVGAIVLSKLAGFVVSKRTADQMGVGALTVVMHEAAKDLIVKTMPTVKLDGIGYYSPALPSAGFSNGSGGFEDVNGMGMYVGRPGAVSMGMYAGGEGEDMGNYY